MSAQDLEIITVKSADDLNVIPSASRDVVVLSTHFNPNDKLQANDSTETRRLLDALSRVVKVGGWLFVYGTPRDLPTLGVHLMQWGDDTAKLTFKYWIALDIDDSPANGFLKPTHLGLLMFLKARADVATPQKFTLNTDTVRIPHLNCAACGRTLKDWGGKKHLMNPRGATMSDVWRDLPRCRITDSIIPDNVLKRVIDLTRVEGGTHLHVIQESGARDRNAGGPPASSNAETLETRGRAARAPIAVAQDQVLQTDCVSYLNDLATSNPEGVFDLAFADPPYNLQKLYGAYDDALAGHRYIEWCDAWLDGMARSLKPGGSLFVLNLPQWCMHHAAFLNSRLEFRHWIVWDALSDPRGKIMPAHYGLLYYTKPSAQPVFNYRQRGNPSRAETVSPPDSPKYCLRGGCIKERKRKGDDEKVSLSDIWFDIHRIKHKRDRDAHPCQLPEKLLERIIVLTTQPGGLIFDPFCGAGTTAIAAAKLGRHYIVTDVDSDYVRITRDKLAAMKNHADLFGHHVVPRNSVKRPRLASSKREIETYLQNLARKLGRAPTEQDVQSDDAEMLSKIDLAYPYRDAALKRAKIVLGV
ncbi:MAG TPA: site-specific DNA-methyltransferase [Verrucomicrobiota bacterium]|nr:site-specific DNA-methyltransferase [Verrucomicrobiota bacterium]